MFLINIASVKLILSKSSVCIDVFLCGLEVTGFSLPFPAVFLQITSSHRVELALFWPGAFGRLLRNRLLSAKLDWHHTFRSVWFKPRLPWWHGSGEQEFSLCPLCSWHGARFHCVVERTSQVQGHFPNENVIEEDSLLDGNHALFLMAVWRALTLELVSGDGSVSRTEGRPRQLLHPHQQKETFFTSVEWKLNQTKLKRLPGQTVSGS